MINLTEFLEAFFPDQDEKIYIRALPANDEKRTKANSPRKITITRRELIENKKLMDTLIRWNQHRGLYFVVNSGGNTDKEITHFNAFFVENDSLSIQEQHERLDRAPLSPSIRVKTRRSIHAYWLLDSPLEMTEENEKKWEQIQEKLIAYFDADPAIKNPSRLMRLPFFYHIHYNEKTGLNELKQIEIHTFEPSRRYSLDEMQKAFSEVEKTILAEISERSKSENLQIMENKRAEVEKITEGNRNSFFTSLAGTMRRRGMSEKSIAAALMEENKSRCDPPMDEKEVIGIAKSISRYEPNKESGISGHSKEKTGLNFTNLTDLLTEPEEEIAYIWDLILPAGGFSIVSAKPKVGKSTFVRNLALAVLNGEEFLGRATTKGKILYLSLEEKRSEIRHHFKIMKASGLDIWTYIGPPPAEFWKNLAVAITKYDPVLVIIDPLSRVLRVSDYNEYGSMSKGLEPFIDLARKTGVHIHVPHHESKIEKVGGDALLGSTALFAAVDTHIQLRKDNDIRIISSTQRYGEDIPNTIIEFNKETGIITAKGEMATTIMERTKLKIIQSMKPGEILTTKEIKKRIGMSSGSVPSGALKALVKEGILLKSGEGKKGNANLYSLVKEEY